MIRIEVFQHPFAARPPKVYHAGSLALWLLEHYGDSPAVRVQLFRGAAPCGESDITGNIDAIKAADCDVYTVLESPAGIDPISWAYFIAAVVLAVVAVSLMPKPAMPANVNRTQSSPNNSLSDRQNKLRMLERVEDIYGTVRAVPSLMMPTYIKYLNNIQYEYGYYCVSRGYVMVEDVRDAQTLVADIPGASASVYYPFTSPNSGDAPVVQIGAPIIDQVVSARRAEEVDGITLLAPNQVNLPPSSQYDFTSHVGGSRIMQYTADPAFDSVMAPGDQITVAMDTVVQSTTGSATVNTAGTNTVSLSGIEDFAEVGWEVAISGFSNGANNGVRTVLSVGVGIITVSGAAFVTETNTANLVFSSPNYSGTYEVAEIVSPDTIALTTNPFAINLQNVTAAINVVGGSEWTQWVTLPDVNRTQVWVNILAPQGMYKDQGGGKIGTDVTFQLQIEQLDADLNPTGQIDTTNAYLVGATSDEVADTVERVTPWRGPIRVRMRRTSNFDFGFDGTVIDEIKWRDLYAVSEVDRNNFGNKTTLHTVTKATERATSIRSRELNVLASRLLPLYNGSTFTGYFDETGLHVNGTIHPTSQISDILAAVALDPYIGRRDINVDIDMPQIWSVNQRVNAMHPEAGQFNYTFDSDSLSFEETVVAIANAGFCIAYRQNGKIRLAFDCEQDSSTALFTHRNKRPDSDTITRKFASDSEFDGVEFVYRDPDSNTDETILLPQDKAYQKLKKIELPGVRSFAQAWIRANREFYKILGQRITIETDATNEARALLPNARIDIVDNTRYESMDGEVVGQIGMELRLSRAVKFSGSDPHSIVLIRRDGSIEGIPVEPGSDDHGVMLTRLPTESVVTEYGPDGVRTSFSFAPDSARAAMAYLVQEIDQSDPQYAKIRAINYSADYYQMDKKPIPPKASIIN